MVACHSHMGTMSDLHALPSQPCENSLQPLVSIHAFASLLILISHISLSKTLSLSLSLSLPLCAQAMPPLSDLSSPVSRDLSSSHNGPLRDGPGSDPPESFWVPKEHELDWLTHNAFMERKGSTKISFSGNLSSGPRHGFHGSQSSPSQRSSLNSKTKVSIFGLPKSQKSCFADANFRRNLKPEKVRLFWSRCDPAVHDSEPGSPSVSCMGRVRSKKGRGKRTGLWSSLRTMLRNRVEGK